MSSTNDIIRFYSSGMKFRGLEVKDFVEVEAYKIEELAEEYGVNINEFKTDRKEFLNYVSKFGHIVEYKELMRKSERNEIAGLFGILLSALISLLIFQYSIYIACFIFTPLALLFTVLISGLLKIWNTKRLEKKFVKIYVGERNRNVENFINEVMFQAYVMNRNPKVEYKYSRT